MLWEEEEEEEEKKKQTTTTSGFIDGIQSQIDYATWFTSNVWITSIRFDLSQLHLKYS